MSSTATVDVTKLDLTPVRVKYGVSGSEVDLGATLSNVVVEIKYSKADMKADQFGITVLDRRVSGFEAKVTTEVAQILDAAIWKVVFPNSTMVTVSGHSYVDFKVAIGQGDQALSKRLILHPLSFDDSNLDGDLTFHKATASAESTTTYSPTEQQKLKIVWNILPDLGTSPPRFLRFGNINLVGTNASFSAAVAGGGNVGNGTVSGIVVNNPNTKTETITLTCVGTNTNAGNFSVSGSISGPLGIATVGVAFISNPIDFTINDGTTDFAQADSFTIATVAAQ